MAILLPVFALIAPINSTDGEGFFRFLGRFHVLILHFPITLLLLVAVLSNCIRYDKWQSLGITIPLLWWLSSVTVFITVSFGLLLAANEGYDLSEVRPHLLAGIATAVLAFICTGLAGSNLTQTFNRYAYISCCSVLTLCVFIAAHAGGNLVHGDTYLTRFAPEKIRTVLTAEPEQEAMAIQTVDDPVYPQKIRPALENSCFSCHGPDKQKGGVQLDILNPDFVNGQDAAHWHAALDMINSGEMPPKNKPQFTAQTRRQVVDWITQGLEAAKQAKVGKQTKTLRRLSKAQYNYSLQDLFELDVDFDKDLPDDPLSEMGFSNHAELLQNSALHLQTFESIARKAVNAAIDTSDKPKVHHYRLYFGKGIGQGKQHTQSRGYMDRTISTDDFRVEMFDEAGNKTPMAAEKQAQLLKYFSVSLRGSNPNHFKLTDKGLTLFSAKPHLETTIAGQYGAWNGPSPNVSLQLKDLFPQAGPFAIRIKASKADTFEIYRDSANVYKGELVDSDKIYSLGINKINKQSEIKIQSKHRIAKPDTHAKNPYIRVHFNRHKVGGQYYQINLVHAPIAKNQTHQVDVKVGSVKQLTRDLQYQVGNINKQGFQVTPLATAFLANQKYNINLNFDSEFPGFHQLEIRSINPNHQLVKLYQHQRVVKQIATSRKPVILPYIGSRADDGMDYKNLGTGQVIEQDLGQAKIYTFVGRLEDMPVPVHGTQGDHITSGSLKVGLWNHDLVKSNQQAGSAINVEYIEFEAPFFEQWPTASHSNIFINSEHPIESEAYAKQVIHRFAEKAFRRALMPADTAKYVQLWRTYHQQTDDFKQSIKETLVAILCSPNFLYMVEPEVKAEPGLAQKLGTKVTEILGISSAWASPQQAPIDDFSLANRLSYFLWNSSPDKELLKVAGTGQLHQTDLLNQQINRMLENDQKLERFVKHFTHEWLRLDRQIQQRVDVQTYPDYTRFVKSDMQQQTQAFFKYLIQQDKSILQLIDSDTLMLNQNLAEFYGIKSVVGTHFRPVTKSKQSQYGGLLTQGAFLTGHADGVHSHPVKRAVWLKSKILGDEPPPPPPNVPEIDPETPGFENLTLKQQLELHRDKDSCRDCHAKIDPYGVVLESFDAVGRVRHQINGKAIDDATTLPDGTQLQGISELKAYLLDNNQAVVMSLIKHMYAYALGKNVSFHESEEIEQIYQQVKDNNYSMQSLIKAIITSPSFTQA